MNLGNILGQSVENGVKTPDVSVPKDINTIIAEQTVRAKEQKKLADREQADRKNTDPEKELGPLNNIKVAQNKSDKLLNNEKKQVKSTKPLTIVQADEVFRNIDEQILACNIIPSVTKDKKSNHPFDAIVKYVNGHLGSSFSYA